MKINLEGDVGYEITAYTVRSLVNQLEPNEDLEITLCSFGGSFFEGLQIYNELLKAKSNGHRIITNVSSICASASTYILFASDVRRIYSNSFVMVHNSLLDSGQAMDKAGMQQALEKLTKYDTAIAEIYAENSNETVEYWATKMNEETWFSAKECVELGICDEIISADAPVFNKVTNQIDLEKLPEELKQVLTSKTEEVEEEKEHETGDSEEVLNKKADTLAVELLKIKERAEDRRKIIDEL